MLSHANPTNDLDDTKVKYKYENTFYRKWYDHILLNRPLKVTLALLVTAVAAPLLLYNFHFVANSDRPPVDGYSVGSCLIPRDIRLPCGVGNMTHNECHAQCCYDLITNYCFHRLPSRFSYIIDQPWHENLILQPRVATVPYSHQNSITKVRLSIDELSPTHLSLKFYDASHSAFEGTRIIDKNYTYEVTSPEINVIVNSTYGTIFNTARGPLIASENIWELSFKLTNESMYGLGEIPLIENTVKIIYSREGGMSAIPLIFARLNNTFHGFLIDTTDPTEVSIHGDNQIVIRSITNFGFYFHLFLGPTPEDIMNDAMTVTGRNSRLEYWMLGAHICNEVPDTNLSSFIADATRNGLPYESLCGHGSITFDNNQCEVSNGSNIADVREGANVVKKANKRFVPHVSPHIRYHEENLNETYSGEEIDAKSNKSCKILPSFKNIMYRDPLFLQLYRGIVEDYEVLYPSYENASIDLMNSLWPYDVIVDGVVLENSWPLDQREKTFNESKLRLPYFNDNLRMAFQHTPRWDLVLNNNYEQYMFKHNNYGNEFSKAMKMIVDETIIWTNSPRMNGDVAVNRQKINATWTDLNKELIEAALGGISGHWLWSSPICGDMDDFNLDNHASLCVKWYMATTFLPMIKIHSKITARHPLAFTGTHRSLIIAALRKRLSLLPYFFTTLQKGPLLRPMFYQFPQSEGLQNLSTQFSVGDDLMIVPNLHPSQSHVHVWLPPGTWYELWSGLKLNGEEGDAVTMTTTEADLLTLIRGGSILVVQKDTRESATDTRLLSSFSIIIALECVTKNETVCTAFGNLFMTKDITFEFKANAQNLTVTARGNNFESVCNSDKSVWANEITEISIYGLDEEFNNYDHSKSINVDISLCNLEVEESLLFDIS